MSVSKQKNSPDRGYVKTGTNRVSNDDVTPRWMQYAGDRQADEKKITRNDLTSLTALIVYLAHKSGIGEFNLEQKVANHFDIPNISCLPARQYNNALRYLIDSNV